MLGMLWFIGGEKIIWTWPKTILVGWILVAVVHSESSYTDSEAILLIDIEQFTQFTHEILIPEKSSQYLQVQVQYIQVKTYINLFIFVFSWKMPSLQILKNIKNTNIYIIGILHHQVSLSDFCCKSWESKGNPAMPPSPRK